MIDLGSRLKQEMFSLFFFPVTVGSFNFSSGVLWSPLNMWIKNCVGLSLGSGFSGTLCVARFSFSITNTMYYREKNYLYVSVSYIIYYNELVCI